MALAYCLLDSSCDIALGRHWQIGYVRVVQATIDIDPQLVQAAEQLARRKGQPLSVLVEQPLRYSLRTSQTQPGVTELYGEPLADEDIAESACVTFRALDE